MAEEVNSVIELSSDDRPCSVAVRDLGALPLIVRATTGVARVWIRGATGINQPLRSSQETDVDTGEPSAALSCAPRLRAAPGGAAVIIELRRQDHAVVFSTHRISVGAGVEASVAVQIDVGAAIDVSRATSAVRISAVLRKPFDGPIQAGALCFTPRQWHHLSEIQPGDHLSFLPTFVELEAFEGSCCRAADPSSEVLFDSGKPTLAAVESCSTEVSARRVGSAGMFF